MTTKRIDDEEIVLVVHQPGKFSMLIGEPSLSSARSVGASRLLRFDETT